MYIVISYRPDQDMENYGIIWRRKLTDSIAEVKVPEEGKFLLEPDKTLMLQSVSVEDAGYYSCYRQDTYEAIYLLDVIGRERKTQVLAFKYEILYP